MPDIYMDVDLAVIAPMNILPIVQSADGITIEQALVYNFAGIAVQWNFCTCAGVMTTVAITPTTAGVYDISEPLANVGMYGIEIPASGGASANNDTEGTGWITGKATGLMAWRGPTIGFRRAALNDLLIEGGTASTNLEDFFDGTGYVGGTIKQEADIVKIHGTALTETSTQLAGAFTKFFNVATPTGTVNSIPDAVAGAANGLAIIDATGVKLTKTVDLTAGQSIAASSVPAVVLANSASHGGAASVITLLTPIAATVPNTQKVDVETIKTQAVTCAAGVTVLASVGTAATSTAQTGDSYGIVNGAKGLVDIHDTLDLAHTDIDAILADTGTDGVVIVAASKTGYTLSDAGVDAVFDRASSLTLSFESLLTRTYQMTNNKMNVTDATGAVALRNIGDTTTLATGSVTDNLTTTVRTELTWA